MKIFVLNANVKINKVKNIKSKFKEQGKLICCDNCFKAFHLSCLELKKTPTGKWECPFCDDLTKNNCMKCNKNKENSIKLTCSLCYRMYLF